MKASFAKQVSEAAEKKISEDQYVLIEAGIRKAAEKGRFSLAWDNITHENRKRLVDDGFELKRLIHASDLGNQTYVISWR